MIDRDDSERSRCCYWRRISGVHCARFLPWTVAVASFAWCTRPDILTGRPVYGRHTYIHVLNYAPVAAIDTPSDAEPTVSGASHILLLSSSSLSCWCYWYGYITGAAAPASLSYEANDKTEGGRSHSRICVITAVADSMQWACSRDGDHGQNIVSCLLAHSGRNSRSRLVTGCQPTGSCRSSSSSSNDYNRTQKAVWRCPRQSDAELFPSSGTHSVSIQAVQHHLKEYTVRACQIGLTVLRRNYLFYFEYRTPTSATTR